MPSLVVTQSSLLPASYVTFAVQSTVYFLFRFMYYNLKPFHLKKKKALSVCLVRLTYEKKIHICKTKLKKKKKHGME